MGSFAGVSDEHLGDYSEDEGRSYEQIWLHSSRSKKEKRGGSTERRILQNDSSGRNILSSNIEGERKNSSRLVGHIYSFDIPRYS